MNERFFVFCLAACLWIVAACAYGFVFGFVAFLTVVAVFALPCWMCWRFGLCRSRVQRCGAFVGEFLGDRYYLLEGVA